MSGWLKGTVVVLNPGKMVSNGNLAVLFNGNQVMRLANTIGNQEASLYIGEDVAFGADEAGERVVSIGGFADRVI